MGQYYHALIIKDKVYDTNNEQVLAWLYSHEYDNGLKLMEHSWIGNNFVETFASLLSPKGKFTKMRVVWAGDYADGEPELTYTDDKGSEVEVNLYRLCADKDKIKPKTVNKSKYRFIFNHDTKEFVDTEKCPISDIWKDPKTGKEHTFTIHPLPLLTCEGCFRGGGDFRDETNTFVGKWSRNRISVGNKIVKGFIEIVPNFVEK
jgi:hypothetical protein